ncbi:MAG: tetratricopeptide repeat protein [Planctomycetes bacterium]|nr:tetratricopeptide repeat protein [Planctomycetota bacterium]
MRFLAVLLALALPGAAHAGFAFSYSHSGGHSNWSVTVRVGGYGSSIVPVGVRSYGSVIHGLWRTPGDRFIATTENVWLYNPYNPPSYRTFGLVYLDADGSVTGVSEYPRSGHGFDFDLTVLQHEAAIREKGLGRAEAEEKKARRKAIQVGLAFLREKNYRDAQTALKDAVWADPEDGPAAMLFGIALLAAGDVAPAGKAIRRGLEAMPEFKSAWARLADLVPDRAERDRIAADIDSRLKASQDDANARFLAGWILFSTGEAAKAGEHWKQLPEDPLRARLVKMAGE